MTTVLFDEPGPRARARHRAFTALAAVGILVLLALAAYQLYREDQFAYDKWEPFVTPRYLRALLEGLLRTLEMAVAAILLALTLGVALGVGKLSEHAWARWPCWAVVEFFRAVPVLLMMTLVFFAYGITRGESGAFWSVVVALMVYNGAVLAEVFRAGVLALPPGQAEAAYAVGMRKNQVMRIVLLPQAVKIMLPAIISQCVVALKDTSLGYAVAAPGLAWVGRNIWVGFGNQIPTVIVLAAVYVAINLVLTAIATWVQRRYVGERPQLEVPPRNH
jgi:glutamate transport system permease protein